MKKVVEFDRTNSVSIFWDFENVRQANQAKFLLTLAKSFGRLKNTKAYAQWRKEHQASEMTLHDLDFDCIDIPRGGKNSVDAKLISSCYREFVDTSTIILVSGDGDYRLLVSNLLDEGIRVIIVAGRGSLSEGLQSLVNSSDVYYVDQLSQFSI